MRLALLSMLSGSIVDASATRRLTLSVLAAAELGK